MGNISTQFRGCAHRCAGVTEGTGTPRCDIDGQSVTSYVMMNDVNRQRGTQKRSLLTCAVSCQTHSSLLFRPKDPRSVSPIPSSMTCLVPLRLTQPPQRSAWYTATAMRALNANLVQLQNLVVFCRRLPLASGSSHLLLLLTTRPLPAKRFGPNCLLQTLRSCTYFMSCIQRAES